MSFKVIAGDELIKWCDVQIADGHILSMHWEGGGDSGWCSFRIDGEDIPWNEEEGPIRNLLDLMYDLLDYGSWAGEFSAFGEAIYDPEEKAFVGVDKYSEDYTAEYPCNIEVRVPKKLWFDSMEIQIEGEENPNISVAFLITNGFLTDEHDQWIPEFESSFAEKVYEVIDNFSNDYTQEEYRSIWENITLTKIADFTEDGDYMVHTLTSLSIGTSQSEDKDIYLQLQSENDES